MYITSANVHLEMGKVLIVMSPFRIKYGEICCLSCWGPLPTTVYSSGHSCAKPFIFVYILQVIKI